MQEAGTVVGERYRLVHKIGEGGLAAVWRGEHLTLGSPIAIKFLHRTGPMQSDASQRFLREARVAASVRHRNVVEIVDFGFTESEIPYMVMEFLEGRSLGDYLEEKGKLTFAEAAEIVAGTLRGLVAVHAAGLVHRDIKPDNVFLVNDPEEGVFAKLVDFGLSRRAGRSDMTAEGTLMGTPQYMSPEQASGNADIDGRTDIYSMGVVLYELVSGVLPFDSEALAEVLKSVVNDAPTPIRELVPDIPEKLEFVIETAMAKNREHRFVDARAMRISILDSGVYTAHEPVSGLITRPMDPSLRVSTPTLSGAEELGIKMRPVAKPVGLDGSGAQRPRRDPSLGKTREEADAPAVFAVSREEPGAASAAAPRKAARLPLPAVLVVILLIAIAGVALLLWMNQRLPGTMPLPAFAGTGEASDAEISDAGSLSADAEPSADAAMMAILVEDAGASPDAWASPDAGTEDASLDGGFDLDAALLDLDAGAAVVEDASTPRARTRPTKRTRRTVRRRGTR